MFENLLYLSPAMEDHIGGPRSERREVLQLVSLTLNPISHQRHHKRNSSNHYTCVFDHDCPVAITASSRFRGGNSAGSELRR
jgi:hypothetical protein